MMIRADTYAQVVQKLFQWTITIYHQIIDFRMIYTIKNDLAFSNMIKKK